MRKETIDFLKQHDFTVKVSNIGSYHYLAQFPECNKPKIDYQYYLLKDEWIITRFPDKTNFTLQVEDYEIRPIILSDILIKSANRNLSVDLIYVYDKNNKNDTLYNVLPEPSNLEKESALTCFIMEYLTNKPNYSWIEKFSLQSSFDKFIQIYDTGGIL